MSSTVRYSEPVACGCCSHSGAVILAEIKRLQAAVHELEETVSRVEAERNERGQVIFSLRQEIGRLRERVE